MGTRRLHVKSFSTEHFESVVVVPGGAEAFVLDADLLARVVLEQAQGGSAQQAEVGVGVAVA